MPGMKWINAEHLCVGCGTTGYDDDMQPLYTPEDPDYVDVAWIHGQCLGSYMVKAGPLELSLLGSKMKDKPRS